MPASHISKFFIRLRYCISAIVFLFLLDFPDMEAQIMSGYRFGVNLTNMSIISTGNKVETELPVGIHFGMNYEISLNDILAVQSGFLFTSKGTDYRINNVYHSIAPSYIEIPVNTACYFGTRPLFFSCFRRLSDRSGWII